MSIAHYALSIVHCTLFIVRCTLSIVHCASYHLAIDNTLTFHGGKDNTIFPNCQIIRKEISFFFSFIPPNTMIFTIFAYNNINIIFMKRSTTRTKSDVVKTLQNNSRNVSILKTTNKKCLYI